MGITNVIATEQYVKETTITHANSTSHITNEEREAWNNKSNFSGSYNDLTNKPAIPTTASDVNADTKGTAETKVSEHNTSTYAHNDIRILISDLATEVSKFLDVDDTTKDQLSEVLTLIDNNKGTLDSLTTSKVNVVDIIDNLTTASANKVLSANQGVVLKSLIDNLSSLLESKANENHNHDDAYYTKDDIDNMELITVEDIDAIWGSTILMANSSEVKF